MPYQRGNQWYATYYVDGKKTYVAFPGTPEGEKAAKIFELEKKLERKKSEVKVEQITKEEPIVEKKTIEKVVENETEEKTLNDIWMKWQKLKSGTKRAWKTDEQNYRNHVEPFFKKDTLLKDINRDKCQDFMIFQRNKNKSGNQFSSRTGKLAPRSINKHRTLLLGMLNEARALDWISKVPQFDEEETSEVDRGHLENADQIQAFTSAVEYEAKGDEVFSKADKKYNHNKGVKLKKTWVKPFFMTLLYAGLRHAELAQLEWDDIILTGDTKKIRIINDKTFNTKTKRNREVPILDDLLPYLIEWRKLNPKATGLVFPNRNGNRRPATDSAFRRAWNNICKIAGLEGNAIPYMLRHTFATKMLEGGLSAPQLQRLMGHKSFDTTLKYASHVSDDYEIKDISFGGKK